MTGADPNTRWLDGCIALNNKGFIKTGPDLSAEDLMLQDGPLLVSHTCLKPVYLVFLQLAMCEVAVLNVLHLQWVKDRLRSHLFIKYLQE